MTRVWAGPQEGARQANPFGSADADAESERSEFVHASDESKVGASESRMIHFPGQSQPAVGEIAIFDADASRETWNESWESLGKPEGDVIVPSGKSVFLMISMGDILHRPIDGPDGTLQTLLAPVDSDLLRLVGLQYGRGLTDEHAKALQRFRSLEVLGIMDFLAIDEAAVQSIGALSSLAAFYIVPISTMSPGAKRQRQFYLSGHNLAALSRLDHLEILSVGNCDVTDDVLAQLPNLRNLRSLDVEMNPITGEAFDRLPELPLLRTLDLTSTDITDGGLRAAAQRSSLEELYLSNTPVTDIGVFFLRDLPELKILILQNTSITDQAVETLSMLKSLATLDITDTGISIAGERKLREALPTCEIRCERPAATPTPTPSGKPQS